MAGKKRIPLWRRAFLRELARTGNVEAAAFVAGVDKSTIYEHRKAHPEFVPLLEAARAKGKAAAAKGPRAPARKPREGREELVERRTKEGGAQLVRAGPGRWCKTAEDAFFNSLSLTGCVRRAALACGFSTNALYARRNAYPAFAARWAEVEARSVGELPHRLRVAALAALSPEANAEGDGAPDEGAAPIAMTAADAIRISEMKGGGGKAGGKRPWAEIKAEDEARKEELVEQVVKLLGLMKKRQRAAKLAEGWSEAEDGTLIPPGWVRGTGGGEGEPPPEAH